MSGGEKGRGGAVRLQGDTILAGADVAIEPIPIIAWVPCHRLATFFTHFSLTFWVMLLR